MNPSLKATLTDLKGTIIIDETFEKMVRRIVGNRLREARRSLTFPFVLTLRAFIHDLGMRIEFMEAWIKQRSPVRFIIRHSFTRSNSSLLDFTVMHGRMVHLSIDSVDNNTKTSD
jgi:hypothetical protein